MKDDLFFWGSLAVLAIGLGPLMTIWALNTVFGLSIPLTFNTWFAVLWIGGTALLAALVTGLAQAGFQLHLSIKAEGLNQVAGLRRLVSAERLA